MPRQRQQSESSSPHRPRRAALRTVSKHASLAQRRTHFERVVQRQISQRKVNSATPCELWKIDPSALPDDGLVSLDPDDVKDCLQNTETAPHYLCSVLQQLRKFSNEASSDEESNDFEPSGDADASGNTKAVADTENSETSREKKSSSNNQESEENQSDATDLTDRATLENLAQVLADKDFIDQESYEIRIFTACSLAEILRISAPNPPLSESKLKAVCNLFIDELSVIAVTDDHLKSYRFALLEQLAAVKTFAIFSGEEHVIADIFACFYAAVRPFQPEKYKEHLGFILDTLLSEVQSIGQPLLDALLAPLSKPFNKSTSSDNAEFNLRSFAGYSTSAIELAEHVVVTSKNLLQVPICNFFNSALQKLSKGRVLTHSAGQKSGIGRRRGPRSKDLENSDNDPDFEIVGSELEDDIENLVVAVYRIAPSILIYVIPSLEDRLRAKDPIVRRNIAHLLGKLFISSAEATSIYSSVFTEFLHRSRDIDPNLRAEVCQTLGSLIASTPNQRDTLNKALSDRVLDQSEFVREAVARSVGETESFASKELITNLATRLRDRKPAVREETLRQLTALYKTQLKKVTSSFTEVPMESFPSIAGDLVEALEEDIEFGVEVSLPNSRRDRAQDIIPEWLDELPNLLLNCYQALQPLAEFEFLGIMDRFMFEQMLPWGSDSEKGCDTRVRRFASFLANLDGRILVFFSTMVHRHAQLAETLLKICSLRLQQAATQCPKPNQANGKDKTNVSEVTPVREVKKTFAKKPMSSPETLQPEAEKKLDDKLTADLLKLSNTLSALVGRRKVQGEDSKDLCWKMCNFADRKFFEQIKIVLDPTSSSLEALSATQDATARLSSKSALGEFVGTTVLPAARFLMFSTRHLESGYRQISNFCKIVSDEHELRMIDKDFFENNRDFTFIHENDVLFGLLRFIELAGLHFPDSVRHVQPLAFDIIKQATDKSLPVQQVLMNGCKTIARVEWRNVEETIRNELIEQFRNLMVAPVVIDAQVSSVMAKWATRAHIQLCKELDGSDEIWKETLAVLRRQLAPKADDATLLVTTYSSLAQLAKHNPAVFKPLSIRAFDHAYFLVSGVYNEALTSKVNLKSSSDSEEEEERESYFRLFWKSSFTPVSGCCRLVCEAGIISNLYVACLAELCGRGIKILTYCVQALDFDDDDFERLIVKLNYVSESQKGDVFALRVPLVDENGNEVEDDDRFQNPVVVAAWNVIRLSCSSAILHLARSKQFSKRLSPTHLNWALLCCQDRNSDVRISFARNLQRAVVRKGLPFRWIAALSLMAVDPDKENFNEARDILTSALRRRRNNIRLKLQNSTLASLRPHLPEVTVPVLIWLIAKHPDRDDEKEFYEHAERMLDFLLDRLLDSNEYAAVINEYLDALAVAKDRTETDEGVGPSTERIHKLTRICSLLLKKKQSGRKWNLIEHPGTVALPGDLFRKGSTVAESSNAGPIPTFLDAAKRYDEDAAPAELPAAPEPEPVLAPAAQAPEKHDDGGDGGDGVKEEAAPQPTKEDSATNSGNTPPHLTVETPNTVRKLRRSRSRRSTRSVRKDESGTESKPEIRTPDSGRKSVSSRSSARTSGKRKRRSTKDSQPLRPPPSLRRSLRNSNTNKQT